LRASDVEEILPLGQIDSKVARKVSRPFPIGFFSMILAQDESNILTDPVSPNIEPGR
jgi:hypothetical protein